MQESLARFALEGRPAPNPVLCLHESVALAAAHGYYMVTGQVQVVMVHTDVGTLNLGANLHNAQRGRAGIVILAGESPLASSGDDRNRDTDWIQEQDDQSAIVAGYVKWRHRVTDASSVSAMIDRAFQLAAAAPAGPVYLTLPRDVQLAPVLHDDRSGRPPQPPSEAPLPAPSAVTTAADWLLAARQPLILTAYAGRDPHAVGGLVRLAETIGAPVIELRQRLNFPSTHPLHLGFCAMPYLERADCVLVVDHDVPWVPAQGSPPQGSKVIQIDVDPHKRDLPNWHLPVDLVMQADAGVATHAIAEEVARRASTEDRARIQSRRDAIAAEHRALADGWAARACALESRTPIAPDFAAACLNEIIDADSIVVNEAVSNNPVLWHHVRLDAPGTWFQSLGSGLGWGLGAALGAKLAAPKHTVISIVGDGSWVFGSPLAVYWAAERCGSPFLTVVFNNRAYAATIDAISSDGAKRSGPHLGSLSGLQPAGPAVPRAGRCGAWSVGPVSERSRAPAVRAARGTGRSARRSLGTRRHSSRLAADRARPQCVGRCSTRFAKPPIGVPTMWPSWTADASPSPTYSWSNKSAEIVAGLRRAGLQPGDRIGVVLPDGPDLAVAVIGMSAGATVAPLNAAAQDDEIGRQLECLGCRAVVVAESDQQRTAHLRARGIDVLELVRLEAAAGLFTLRSSGAAIEVPPPVVAEPRWADADDVALALHTSGTAGEPKLVLLTHANLSAAAAAIAEALELTPRDRALSVMPLFHIHGLSAITATLMTGGSITCPGVDGVMRLPEWLEQFRPTWLTASPTIHRELLAQARQQPDAIWRHSLRFIRSASAPMPQPLIVELEQVFAVPFIEAYGMTEASPQIASNRLADPSSSGWFGRPSRWSGGGHRR